MAGIKLNARDVILEISNGAVIPTWTEVGGLTSLTYKPSENEETVDTTTFTSEGLYEGEIMQRGAMLEAEGFLIKDHLTGVQEAGQAQVETLATLLGPASVGQIRFRHPVDTTWRLWNCYASVGEQGGGNNDKASWKAEFTRCGASTSVAVA